MYSYLISTWFLCIISDIVQLILQLRDRLNIILQYFQMSSICIECNPNPNNN